MDAVLSLRLIFAAKLIYYELVIKFGTIRITISVNTGMFGCGACI